MLPLHGACNCEVEGATVICGHNHFPSVISNGSGSPKMAVRNGAYDPLKMTAGAWLPIFEGAQYEAGNVFCHLARAVPHEEVVRTEMPMISRQRSLLFLRDAKKASAYVMPYRLLCLYGEVEAVNHRFACRRAFSL